jgi:hypothetical protein
MTEALPVTYVLVREVDTDATVPFLIDPKAWAAGGIYEDALVGMYRPVDRT